MAAKQRMTRKAGKAGVSLQRAAQGEPVPLRGITGARRTARDMTTISPQSEQAAMTISSRLLRWLGQLHYNHIRRIEILMDATREDQMPLRGVLLADDLVLTRQRAFYRITGRGSRATPVSIHHVAKHYAIEDMMVRYRRTQDAWKQQHRREA